MSLNGNEYRYIFTGVSSSSISYAYWTEEDGNESWHVTFNNDATGSGMIKAGKTGSSAGWNPEGYTTLQQFIDNGRAVFYGQKSGTSGAGSLSVIKAASNFYTDLPDEIVCTQGTAEVLLRLTYLTTTQIKYEAEDHGIGSSDRRFLHFDNAAEGDLETKNTAYWTSDMSDNTLRWYIENGRALYHGSDPVTSRIGQLEDITTLIPLANQIDIPDAILGRDEGGNLRLFKFTQARADLFDYQSNTTNSNFLLSFNVTTGAWIGGARATKEYDDIQAYIAAGRALYYGRTGSNLGQLIANIGDLSDVDTSTIAPINGQVLVYDDADSKWKPVSQSSDFVDLTDTPETLDAGSYLRVNATGDAIEQVKTAPPDGGLGDNSGIQAASNFDGKLPDQLVVKHYEAGDSGSESYGGYMVCELRQVSQNKILYADTWSDGAYRIIFNNNATGDGWSTKGGTNSAAHILSPIDGVAAPSIRQLIDNGYGVFHGQKSGTSGAGSLSVIKSASNFYTDLPDAIVHERQNVQFILNLSHVEADYICYRLEDHGDSTLHDRRIYFNNEPDGSANATNTIFFTAAGSIRHYIENGRALYHGSDPVSSRIGQLEDITTLIPLANQIDIPDAILGRDEGGNLRLFKFTQARADLFDYQSNTTNSNFLLSFNVTTGAWIGGARATKEYDDIQAYIAAGRALYYGRTGSNLGQLIANIGDLSDVDTSTIAPINGQVLVYDDADSKWKPVSQSSDFVDLTDTPETLDAGSYLRVNATGDAIEQVKTAPPDGGAGDNSAIQAASNFAGKLPDQIVMNYTDSGHSGAFVFSFRGILEPQNVISYHDEYNDSGYRIDFNNDTTGTFKTNIASAYARPYEGSTASLQDIIDGGHAIFHGQKSGTSGAGSLSVIKSAADNFYTELPDAIVATTHTGLQSIMRLKFAKSLTDQSDGQNFYYEARLTASVFDYVMVFKDDTDGTFMGHTGQTDNFPVDGSMDQTLRWYIENGRAIYNGGYNESNVVSARIAADGTMLSSNYDWIESVTRHSTGTYTINFKDGHFTSIPTITFGNDYPSGGNHCIVQHDNLSTSSMSVYSRTVEGHNHIDTDFSIMAQHQDRPTGLTAPQYGIKAWGVFNGTQHGGDNHNITGFTGGNVASIVRISKAIYKVTFINPMPHANYSVSGSCNPNGFGGAYFGVREYGNPVTATDFRIELRDASNAYSNSDRISFQVVC